MNENQLDQLNPLSLSETGIEDSSAVGSQPADIEIVIPNETDSTQATQRTEAQQKFAFPDIFSGEQSGKEALTEFYRSAYNTDEEFENESVAILEATHAFPPNAGIDTQRLNAGQYSPEERNIIIRYAKEFPEEVKTVEDRRAYMAREGLTFVLTGNDGKEGPVEQRNFFPMGYQVEYEKMLSTEELSPVGTALEYGRSVITGGGPFALKSLDDSLKAKGLGLAARTNILRQAAQGDFTMDKIQRALQESAQFVAEVPSYYIPQTGRYILGDLLLETAEWMLNEDYSAGEKKIKGFFDWWSTDFTETVDRIAQDASTDTLKVRPETIEQALRPQGLAERTAVYGAAEVPFIALQTINHGRKALVSDLKFQSHLKKRYNKETYTEALEEAAKNGDTFESITENYLRGFANERARRKIASNLDTSFAARVIMPGNQRQKVFKDDLDNISKDLKATELELESALRRQDKKRERIARKRINTLQKKANTINTKILLPQYFRNIVGEGTEQAIVASYTAEAVYKIFGADAELIGVPVDAIGEMAGAIGVSLPGLREVYRVPKQGVAMLFDWFANKATLGNYKQAYLNADKGTKDLLKTIFKEPEGFLAQSFVAGAEEAVRIRRQLVQLSEQTGVDIDVDYFSNTVVDVVALEELRAIATRLDGEISVNTLNDMNAVFSQRIDNNNRMKEMVTKLAETTYTLGNMKSNGQMKGLQNAERLVDGMQIYIADMQRVIAEDKQYIDDVLELQNKAKSLLIKGGMRRAKVGQSTGEDSLVALDDVYFNEEKAIISVSDAEVSAGLADPEAAFEEVTRKINQKLDERSALLLESADGLKSDQAALGASSTHWASLMVGSKRKHIVKANTMYRALDKKYAGARTNVTDFYEKFKDVSDFVNGDIDDYSAGAIRLRGMNLKSDTKVGAKILFNDGAKRGLADLRDQIGDDIYASLIKHAELDGMQPIQQWEGLKAFLKNPGDKAEQVGEYIDAVDASELSDSMLMLLSPGEWRAVDSHMGGILFQKKREGISVPYGNLKKEWNEVSDPNSPMAFMTGYDTGVPKNVTENFYVDFKNANQYYKFNVADRLFLDRDFSKWNKAISRKVMSKRDPDIPYVASQIRDLADKPTQWLDKILAPAQDIKRGGVLNPYELDELVTQRLAKSGGAEYAPELGKYVFVDGDKNTEAVKSILTAHMRGRLVKTEAGRHIIERWDPTTATGAGDGDAFFLEKPLDYNKDEFQNMLNIPVYTRDESGALVQSGTLLNEEEIYSAINIDALEANRLDLKGMFEEADQIISRNKKVAVRELAAEGISAKNDINFTTALAKEFGVNVTEAGLKISDFHRVAEGVFTTITSRTPEKFKGEMARLRNLLASRAAEAGITPANVDNVVNDFIERMTVQHIYNQSAVAAGNMFTKNAQSGAGIKMAMGMDGDTIRQLIGKTDLSGQTEKNLRAVVGDEVYEGLETVGDTLVRLQAKAAKNVTAQKRGISLESLLSRVYNLNREVVSTQWVVTETLIRASRTSGSSMFHAILKDPKVGQEIFDIIESGQIPEYARGGVWARSILREIARFEAMQSFMDTTAGPFIMKELSEDESEPLPPVEGSDIRSQMTRLGYEPNL